MALLQKEKSKSFKAPGVLSVNVFSEEKGICWIADEFSEFRREQNEFPFFVYFS